MKEGGGGGEGSEQASASFHSSPPPPLSFTRAIFRAVFGSRSSFRNRTETLATQVPVVERWSLWRGGKKWRLDCNFMMADSSCFDKPSYLTDMIGCDRIPGVILSSFCYNNNAQATTTVPHLTCNTQ